MSSVSPWFLLLSVNKDVPTSRQNAAADSTGGLCAGRRAAAAVGRRVVPQPASAGLRAGRSRRARPAIGARREARSGETSPARRRALRRNRTGRSRNRTDRSSAAAASKSPGGGKPTARPTAADALRDRLAAGGRNRGNRPGVAMGAAAAGKLARPVGSQRASLGRRGHVAGGRPIADDDRRGRSVGNAARPKQCADRFPAGRRRHAGAGVHSRRPQPRGVAAGQPLRAIDRRRRTAVQRAGAGHRRVEAAWARDAVFTGRSGPAKRRTAGKGKSPGNWPNWTSAASSPIIFRIA